MKNPILKLLSLTGIFVVAFASCTKDLAGVTTYKDNHFTLENNNTNSDISVDLYKSEADYINRTNVIGHYTIKGKSFTEFPLSKLKAGQWYWIDAYNSDYTLTNWAESDMMRIARDSAAQWRFKYNPEETVYPVTVTQTNARRVLLKDEKTSSRWKAVGALDLRSDESIWSTLPANKRYVELTINKNHTGEFRYIDGDTTTLGFTFNKGPAIGYPTFSVHPDESAMEMFFVNTYRNPGLMRDDPPTFDTLVALFNSELYLLKRQ